MTRPKSKHAHTHKGKEPSENQSEPRYIALCGDEYVEADDDLSGLLGILVSLIDPDGEPEDVCVWDGHRIAAAVRADGTVHTFEPAPAPAPAVPKPAKRTRTPP